MSGVSARPVADHADRFAIKSVVGDRFAAGNRLRIPIESRSTTESRRKTATGGDVGIRVANPSLSWREATWTVSTGRLRQAAASQPMKQTREGDARRRRFAASLRVARHAQTSRVFTPSLDRQRPVPSQRLATGRDRTGSHVPSRFADVLPLSGRGFAAVLARALLVAFEFVVLPPQACSARLATPSILVQLSVCFVVKRGH